MEQPSKLLVKKFKGSLSPEETAALDAWIAADESHRKLAGRLLDPDLLDEEYRSENLINTERPLREMQARIARLNRRIFIRRASAAAAAIVLVAGIVAGFLYFGPESLVTGETAAEAEAPEGFDCYNPGKLGAVVVNERGQTVALSASDTAYIANNYLTKPESEPAGKIENLSLEVGRGKEFRITLEDSTVVWLNSESTLSYPEKFDGGERRVSVTGEAYFEVRRDSERPFVVETGGQSIKVYGTTFNVRGYSDEDAVLTTLETGSVSISAIGHEDAALYLSPGHQSNFNRGNSNVTMRTVDPEIVTGWRHGKFVFEEQTLETIMRDLSRWYNFRYEFRDRSLRNVVFMGSVSRYADFKTVISILEDGGDVKFTIENDTIIISHK